MNYNSNNDSATQASFVHCSQINLNCVIDGQDHTREYDVALEHLATCETCQQRLDTLYSHDSIHQEVSSVLRDSGEHPLIEYEQDSIEDLGRTRDYLPSKQQVDVASQLSFLRPATHPELLGRLGRYDIERVVGVGGTGIVLKAYDTELHRVVALKVLASHLAHHASSRVRFTREARAAAAILHPNVLPIYNVESEGESPYLVMQYVAGESLQARVDRVGPLPVEEALRIAKQTAAALAAAHQQGLVHRDVKPANILLEDQTDRAVLSDFGLARTADDAALTRTGVVAGTPQYMSPEQAAGESFDHRSDLFSLGSVLYFMLAGRSPFRGSSAVAVLHRICKYPHDSVMSINNQVPFEVGQLIDSLLKKKPQQRISTAEEVANRLEDLLAKHQRGSLHLNYDGGFWKYCTLVLACCVVVGLFAGLIRNFYFATSVQQNLVQTSEPKNDATATSADTSVATNDVQQDVGPMDPNEAWAYLKFGPHQNFDQAAIELTQDLERIELGGDFTEATQSMFEVLSQPDNTVVESN